MKVELFSDNNKFRQSSCGVQFFHSVGIPFGYHAIIRGFVEELVLDDDPEHDWIDKIRRASASNEARQIAFMKLANQVQRKIGLKAINMGGKQMNILMGIIGNFVKVKKVVKTSWKTQISSKSKIHVIFSFQETPSLDFTSTLTSKKTPSLLAASEPALPS